MVIVESAQPCEDMVLEFWTKELTEPETHALIEKAAAEIEKRGMTAPAVIFLEMHKPLSNIASQAAIALSPFIVPFVGFDFTNDYSRLLSKRENIESLILRLERLSKETAG